ncbi:MAG: thioredoxin domain-containing protein [Patescibacteria group bacterium]
MSAKSLAIFVGIGVAALLIVAAMFAKSDVDLSFFEPPAANTQPRFITSAIPGRDHSRGAEEPELYWIVYTDFECPYCKQLHPEMEQIIAEYGDRVQWIFRHFPVTQLHLGSFEKAMASECVAELGGEDAFWRFASLVFQRTEDNGQGLDVSQLPELAAAIGVNSTEFQSCLASGRFEERVTDDIMLGATSGVSGTPASFLIDANNKAQGLSGNITADRAREILDNLLAE